MMSTIGFFLFSFITLLTAVGVVSSKKTLSAVLFLLLAFTNGAFLLILIGADFVGFLLLIVYIGAIIILFLFIAMFMGEQNNLPPAKKQHGYRATLLVLSAFLFIECASLGMMLGGIGDNSGIDLLGLESRPVFAIAPIARIKLIGLFLYQFSTETYADHLIILVTILLLAMVGAISIVIRDSVDSKRQRISNQTSAHKNHILTLEDVPFEKGVKL